MADQSLLAGVASEGTLGAVKDKLPTNPATSTAQAAAQILLQNIQALLGGTLATALPPGAATAAGIEALRLLLAGTLRTSQTGADYAQAVVTLTAAQAAGTDPIVAANANRRALQFAAFAGTTPSDFKVALAANSANGMPVYGSARDDFAGALCPRGALYLVPSSGLVTGNTIVVWEA